VDTRRGASPPTVKIDLLDTGIASAVIHRNIAMSAGVNIKTLPISDVIHTIPTGEEGAWQLTRTESGAVELYSCASGRWVKVGTVAGTEGGGAPPPEKVTSTRAPATTISSMFKRALASH